MCALLLMYVFITGTGYIIIVKHESDMKAGLPYRWLMYTYEPNIALFVLRDTFSTAKSRLCGNPKFYQ